MKTSELQGSALDWAVAKCQGVEFTYENFPQHELLVYQYSNDWAQGGVIIEREWLDITPWPNESDEDLRWQCKQHDSINCVAFGSTPLIAAMRCYVASQLGEEVEVPNGLA